MNAKEGKDEVSRRSFIRNAAVAGAAVSIVPRHVLGRGFTPPSDKFNVACVGVGGMGRSNLINLASQNLVALCDVDWAYTDKNLSRLDTDISNLQQHIDHPDAAPATGKPVPKIDPEQSKERLNNILHLKNDLIPKAKRYSDYRKMLDQQKDIDGVVIATPDHMHATIALACPSQESHPDGRCAPAGWKCPYPASKDSYPCSPNPHRKERR
ncbi:MAG: twin-arginine translocation signal domain-containing protein, partial [Candidatus Acidiferrales bacterium]